MQQRYPHRNMSRRQVSPPTPVPQPPPSTPHVSINRTPLRKTSLVPHISSSHFLPLVAIATYLLVSIYFAWSQTLPRAITPAAKSNLDLFHMPNKNPANIAFFIRVSKNSIYHLPRLLGIIYHPGNSYAMHFDIDVDPIFVTHAIKKIRTNPDYEPNIFFLPTNIITPRGVSALLNTIAAINLLEENGRPWDYFINLAATDYPLVPIQIQRQLLGLHLGLNFFNLMPGHSWHSFAKDRLSTVWYDESLAFHEEPVTGSLKKLKARNPLIDDLNLTVCSADVSMILSREFCLYLLEEDTPRKLLIAMSFSKDSSLQFFSTLAWNNLSFVNTIVPYPVRLTGRNESEIRKGKDEVVMDAKDGEGQLKFLGLVKQSRSFFTGRFERPNSSIMEELDRRAKHRDTISKIGKHFLRMIANRKSRRNEVENNSP